MKLYEAVKSAIDELKEWIIENPDEYEPHDVISELADSYVPVYTNQLLEWSMENFELATNIPEIGAAFDGKNTPINLIAANIYEYIESKLWDKWDNGNLRDELLEGKDKIS